MFNGKAKRGSPSNKQLNKKINMIARETLTYAHQQSEPIANNNLHSSPQILFLHPPGGQVNKGTYKKLVLDFTVSCAEGAESSVITYPWRVDLVLDRIPSGQSLTDTSALYGNVTPQFTRIINYDAKERFKILRSWTPDRKNTMSAFVQTAGVSNEGYISHIKSTVKLNLVYKGRDQGTLIDAGSKLNTNALYLVFWCPNLSSAPALNPDINGNYVISAVLD